MLWLISQKHYFTKFTKFNKLQEWTFHDMLPCNYVRIFPKFYNNRLFLMWYGVTDGDCELPFMEDGRRFPHTGLFIVQWCSSQELAKNSFQKSTLKVLSKRHHFPVNVAS